MCFLWAVAASPAALLLSAIVVKSLINDAYASSVVLLTLSAAFYSSTFYCFNDFNKSYAVSIASVALAFIASKELI